jgi:hypothetical protein
MQTLIFFSFLHSTFTCFITQFNVFKNLQNLPKTLIHNQSKEETKCCSISFQNPIWNNKFKNYTMFQYELVVKLSTCLVLMLLTCSINITPLVLWIPSLKSLLCERKIIITKSSLFLLINLCNIL